MRYAQMVGWTVYLVSASSVLHAQGTALVVGIAGAGIVPSGQWSQVRTPNAGALASVRWTPSAGDMIGVRADAMGAPTSVQAENFESPGGGFAYVRSSSLLLADAGPELAIPVGAVALYAGAAIGVARLHTSATSAASGLPPVGSASANTTSNPTNLAWGAGCGVRAALGGYRAPLVLELGVQYRDAGPARYLGPAFAVIAPEKTNLTIPMITRRTTFIAPLLGVALRL